MIWNIHKSLVLLPAAIFSTVAVEPILESNFGKLNDEFFDSWSSTEVQVNKLRYTWVINDFSLLEEQTGQVLKSPTFSATSNDECNWCLELFPRGVNSENSGYLSLYLRSLSCKAEANVQFGIVNSAGEEINIKNFYYNYTTDEVEGWNRFVQEEMLLNEESGYLVDDTLTIVCVINDTSVSEEFSTEVKQRPQENELGKDLSFLIDNQVFTDITIGTKDKDFKALKAILAARSQVFKDLFDEEDTPKSKIGKIYLDDFDSKVMHEFLSYIYTDEVSDLQDLLPDLLALAETYNLDRLKSKILVAKH